MTRISSWRKGKQLSRLLRMTRGGCKCLFLAFWILMKLERKCKISEQCVKGITMGGNWAHTNQIRAHSKCMSAEAENVMMTVYCPFFKKKTFVLSGLITNEKLLIKQTFNLLRQCNTIFTFSSGTLLDWALINIVLTGNVIIRVTSCCISHVFFLLFCTSNVCQEVTLFYWTVCSFSFHGGCL